MEGRLDNKPPFCYYIFTMNTNLTAANQWLTGLGVITLVNTGSLFVSQDDVNNLGGPKEVLTALNNKKLFWSDLNVVMGWYVLESF
jgi:hypothetical protein